MAWYNRVSWRSVAPRVRTWATQRGWWLWIRRVLVLGWFIVLGRSLFSKGVPFDRDTMSVWIISGLFVATFGRKRMFAVLIDWIPFIAVLTAYDYIRGASRKLGLPTYWLPQPHFDRWVFFGHEPTVWLQQHLLDTTPRWYDAVASVVYSSFFFLPYLTAAILWLRSRRDFHRWAGRFVTMSFAALIGFTLVPSAPPWAAALCTPQEVSSHPSDPICLHRVLSDSPPGTILAHFTPVHAGVATTVQRISGRGFGMLHLDVARALIQEGQGASDFVAAVPSLHAGVIMLFTLFFWKRSPIWLRVVLVAYPLAMAWALIYSGEHYLFDILAGWLLAAIVTVSFTQFETRRARRKAAAAQ
jgi:membrane-associated phospholipid phosphatase